MFERANASTVDASLHGAIATRRSRRRFDGRPIAPSDFEVLKSLADRVALTAGGGRMILLAEAPDDLFTGIVGSYGAVKGAPSAALFVGPESSDLELGYIGEQLILAASAMGIDTCWIAGSFDRERASALYDLGAGESVRACTPLGYATADLRLSERLMRGAVHSDRRLDLHTIAPSSSDWPAWARQAAEAVRLAPSGANGQPWRLRMDDGALVIGTKEKPYWTRELDCGIAMLHAELGALRAGVKGAWDRLDGRDVAAFRPAVTPSEA